MVSEPIAPGAPEIFADCPLDRFGVKAVRILRNRRADKPKAANNRVRQPRRIFAWALEEGIAGVKGTPACDVPFLKPSRVGGLPTWTAEDVARLEARHPIGTKAH